MKSKAIIHIVDDEEAVRTSLAILLEIQGYAARTYGSGDEFLREVPGTGWPNGASRSTGCLNPTSSSKTAFARRASCRRLPSAQKTGQSHPLIVHKEDCPEV